MSYLRAAWLIRRHIENALRGTLPCISCGKRIRPAGRGLSGVSYMFEFKCLCDPAYLTIAPFGWDYVKSLMDNIRREPKGEKQ